MALRDGADVLVVDRDLAADAPEHRREVRVDPGEHDDGRAVTAEAHHPILELPRDGVGIASGPDDVVAARRERHQIGPQRERGLGLLRDDLGDELAAHREIGVGEIVDLPGEHLRHAVGPPAVTVGKARLRIADALGEGVADRDQAPPGVPGLVDGYSIGLVLGHAAPRISPPDRDYRGPSTPPMSTGSSMVDPRVSRGARVRKGARMTDVEAAPHLGSFAAEHLSPSYPQRAPWGTAQRLRAWQAEALDLYFGLDGPDGVGSGPRDFLAAATPGAGKTTFALRLATELTRRRVIDRIVVVAPTEHLKTQWADAAAARRHPPRPRLQQPLLGTRPPLPRRRRDVRAGGDQGLGPRAAHPRPPHPRDPRRGAPRRRRPELGRRPARGVLAGDPPPAALGHPVPQRHRADPVRRVPPRRARHPRLEHRLLLRVRARACRRRRAARALPRVRGQDALAHEGGRRARGPPGPGQHEGRQRAGVAHGARSRRGSGCRRCSARRTSA